MFNLNLIQKTITTFALVVFLISFVLILYFAVSNPNGFLASSLGSKPITAFTNSGVNTYSYTQDIQIAESVKIKDDVTTLVSQDIKANFTGKSHLTASGVFFIKNIDALSLKLSPLISVELSAGEYIINSNPIKIYVLSGKAIYKEAIIASANQTALWLVDNFKTSEINTDDFVLNRNYTNLIQLLKDIDLAPSSLSSISLDLSSVNNAVIQVNDSEDPELNVGCDSGLLNLQIICDLNRFRAENTLNTLKIDDTLNNLTLGHAVWMDINQKASTIESNGLSYKERCSQAQIECVTEINMNIKDKNEALIINELSTNSLILDKNISQIGLSISGDYLSILLR